MSNLKSVIITIVVNDWPHDRGLLGENGFAAIIDLYYKNKQRRILFDTGASSIVLKHNMQALHLDANPIEAIILSHGHWDHTGGLKEALIHIDHKIDLICHENSLKPKYLTDEKGKVHDIGIQGLITQNDLDKYTSLILTDESIEVADGVITTGTVPRTNNFEKITGNLKKAYYMQGSEKVTDNLVDDLSLIFNLEDGSNVLLTGCCHSGVINTLTHAESLIESTNYISIIGGLHLHDASKHRLKSTIDQLKKYPLQSLAPCHCTGIRGRTALFNAFKSFKDVGVGSRITFPLNSIT